MPIAYTFDAAQRLLNAVATGRIIPAEVADYFANLRAEPWFPVPSLTDVREASQNVSGDEVREIAKLFRQFGATLQAAPIAVLVSSDLAYGLVRMIGLLLDDVAIVHPFRDTEGAMTWLSPHLSSTSHEAQIVQIVDTHRI